MGLVTNPIQRGGKTVICQVRFGVMADEEESSHNVVSESMKWLLFAILLTTEGCRSQIRF